MAWFWVGLLLLIRLEKDPSHSWIGWRTIERVVTKHVPAEDGRALTMLCRFLPSNCVVNCLQQRRMAAPFLVRSIERTVLANDQFVIAPVPETGDEVVDVRYPIERMQDERERGTVAMRRHLGLPARLVAPDPLHEVRFNGRHGFS